MRRLLATAVALAPLMAVTAVRAEVVISTTRTTPIQTSNATGTARDDIRIASGGLITVVNGVAVTVDSNNNFDQDSGSNITLPGSADGTTAILVGPGADTANVTVGGTISVTDDIDPYPDTDSDGDLDGPLANGANRYGVRLTGTTALTGNVLIESTGNILVEGANARAISVERNLTGNVTSFGNMRAVGTNAATVGINGNVTGAVNIGGTVTAQGLGANAVNVQGDVSGRLTLQGQISTTGYRYSSRPTAAQIERLEADDLLQSGSTIVVAGNVAGGVVLDTRPADADTANLDEDADGIPDANEGNSELNAFGSAPALTVGSATRAITLGVAGTGTNAFGLINRGSINANGVYDGIAATAVEIGAGQAVTIAGGIRNDGPVVAVGTEAGATGFRINSGVSTPLFENTNSLTAGSLATKAAQTVVAVDIAAGASLPALTNSGSLLASASGGLASTTAVRDASGTLTSITNSGSIQALLSASDTTGQTTGITTAIDVSANTTGVTYRQFGVTGTPSAADPDSDGDGVTNSREPLTIGNIRFGSGADVLAVENGTVVGDVSFGAGADQLSITGGARVQGAVSDADGLLAVNIANGTLDARQVTSTNVTSLNIGATGDLIVTLDPTAGTNSGFRVNGTATLADGAGLGIRFNSLITSAQRYTIIDANTLVAGTIDQTAVQANSPYLFVVSAGTDVAAGDVYIDARRRTAAEAGLISSEAQAFDAFYAGLTGGGALLDAFVAQGTREGFIELYEQVLPDHSGGPLLSLASGVDAVTRALTGRNATVAPGETSAWLQEINFYADKDKTDTYGFRSEGFGVAGGIERGSSLGALGVSLAFTSSDIQDPEAEAEEVLTANLVELGLYWRAQGQAWTTWARAAGGYATFDSTRQIVTSTVNIQNTSSWNGFTLALAGGASYERKFGRLSVRPEVYAEYFSLSEDGHLEEGPNDSFNLDIESRDGHMFSTVAAVNIGYGFGQDGWIRPELRLGWRQNISVDPGETMARFVSSGSAFKLTPDSIEGGGPIAGFSLSVGNDLGKLSITADAEKIEDYIRYSLLLRASFKF
ncbi:autotransporter outer membrane beta-barrel domain-containing protein [Brevundimonas subvibrioides]|uniref:Autotransporter beta-domain protein n=1 Tax=Brevundimonas subvibrioides (strain ATCC 15264 / DSM 4735 / LMG 14903 / NBRC 16000 / CB 81) TaxID=633149 RepID=D9QHB8_BRESC|nr:autotransporter domain-containing protein [Brevundimonas subvibrioides]ADL01084.1 Autotransporter beta- domain protein [Brevundimonas subvibrioides ATCC 15264]